MGASFRHIVPPLFQDAAFYADFTRCGAQDVGEAILIGGTGRNSFTFSRSSQATYFNAQGVLTTAANNQPRFAFDPVTLVPQGVLIEEQRTNILTQSANVDTNNGWNIGANTTRVGTDFVLGNGITATAYQGAGLGSSDYVSQTFSQTTGVTFTISVWARLVSGTAVNNLITYDNGSGGRQYFSASALTNKPQRFSFTITPTVNTAASLYLCADRTNTCVIALAAAQIETGSFPTSYIPTSGSAVTRAADAFSLQGINIPGNSFGNAAFVEFYAAPNPSVYAGYAIGFGSNSGIYNSGANNVQESNGFSSIQNVSTISPAIIKTCTGSDGVNGRAICMNGAVPTTGTGNFYNNTPLNLTFGALPSSSANLLNAAIKRVAFWTRNLSSAELQEIVNN